MSFRPLKDRARFVVVVLVLVALVDAVAVAVDFDRIDLLNRVIDGGDFTIEEADQSDTRHALVGVVQFFLLALGAAGFLMWFVRAYGNVDALGGQRRWSVKWAGWGWFVPVLALWRPKQIANDIWHASDERRVPGFVNAWWICWLVSVWASQIAARLTFQGDDADSLRSATYAYLFGDAVDILAAALAIAFVRAVTKRQDASIGQ